MAGSVPSTAADDLHGRLTNMLTNLDTSHDTVVHVAPALGVEAASSMQCALRNGCQVPFDHKHGTHGLCRGVTVGRCCVHWSIGFLDTVPWRIRNGKLGAQHTQRQGGSRAKHGAKRKAKGASPHDAQPVCSDHRPVAHSQQRACGGCAQPHAVSQQHTLLTQPARLVAHRQLPPCPLAAQGANPQPGVGTPSRAPPQQHQVVHASLLHRAQRMRKAGAGAIWGALWGALCRAGALCRVCLEALPLPGGQVEPGEVAVDGSVAATPAIHVQVVADDHRGMGIPRARHIPCVRALSRQGSALGCRHITTMQYHYFNVSPQLTARVLLLPGPVMQRQRPHVPQRSTVTAPSHHPHPPTRVHTRSVAVPSRPGPPLDPLHVPIAQRRVQVARPHVPQRMRRAMTTAVHQQDTIDDHRSMAHAGARARAP